MKTRELNQYKKKYYNTEKVVCPRCLESKDVDQDEVTQYWTDDGKYELTYRCDYCDITFDLVYTLYDVTIHADPSPTKAPIMVRIVSTSNIKL